MIIICVYSTLYKTNTEFSAAFIRKQLDVITRICAKIQKNLKIGTFIKFIDSYRYEKTPSLNEHIWMIKKSCTKAYIYRRRCEQLY